MTSSGARAVEYEFLLTGGVTLATVKEGIAWMEVLIDAMKEYF